MELPYSAQAYLGLISTYNSQLWPAVILSLILTGLVFYFMASARENSDRLIGGILALFWAWCGGVFYGLYHAQLSFLAPIVGIIFGVQAALLVVTLTIKPALSFRIGAGWGRWVRLIFIVGLPLLYAGLAFAIENRWDTLRLIGMSPMPTVLFTVALVISARGSDLAKVLLMIIPFLYIYYAAPLISGLSVLL